MKANHCEIYERHNLQHFWPMCPMRIVQRFLQAVSLQENLGFLASSRYFKLNFLGLQLCAELLDVESRPHSDPRRSASDLEWMLPQTTVTRKYKRGDLRNASLNEFDTCRSCCARFLGFTETQLICAARSRLINFALLLQLPLRHADLCQDPHWQDNHPGC